MIIKSNYIRQFINGNKKALGLQVNSGRNDVETVKAIFEFANATDVDYLRREIEIDIKDQKLLRLFEKLYRDNNSKSSLFLSAVVRSFRRKFNTYSSNYSNHHGFESSLFEEYYECLKKIIQKPNRYRKEYEEYMACSGLTFYVNRKKYKFTISEIEDFFLYDAFGIKYHGSNEKYNTFQQCKANIRAYTLETKNKTNDVDSKTENKTDVVQPKPKKITSASIKKRLSEIEDEIYFVDSNLGSLFCSDFNRTILERKKDELLREQKDLRLQLQKQIAYEEEKLKTINKAKQEYRNRSFLWKVLNRKLNPNRYNLEDADIADIQGLINHVTRRK